MILATTFAADASLLHPKTDTTTARIPPPEDKSSGLVTSCTSQLAAAVNNAAAMISISINDHGLWCMSEDWFHPGAHSGLECRGRSNGLSQRGKRGPQA
jgi:hypothetical protein